MTTYDLALDHYDHGRLPQALAAFNTALREQPGDLNVLYRSMLCLVAMREYKACAAWLQRLLPHINPTDTPDWMMGGFHYNLGVAHEASGHWAAADRSYRNSLAFKPDAVLPMINIGSYCYRQGRPDEGKQWHDRALEPATVDIESRPARSFVKLSRGDYLGGFAEYEARWKLPQVIAASYIPPDCWRWKGKPLDGKHILVVGEQGIGDTIFMSRYFPLIEAQGGRIALVCNPVLHRLFQHNFPNVRLYDRTNHPQCRWWVPMMSLPFVFQTTLDTIPSASTPYLKHVDAPGEISIFLKNQRTVDLHTGVITRTSPFRIGWVEAGNPLFMADHDRSAPKGTFAPLLALPGIEWVDLSRAADKARGFTDMADTASLVQSLDLVVTVDTAMFHLAAALGVQTWMLPMTSPTWFCGTNDEPRSPWYGPWHTLYRRTRVDDWAGVIDRIRNDLMALR